MMQGQENVYAEQTQIIEPITVDPPETEAVTAVTPTRPILGTVEILLYTVCTVSCIGILISASITLPAINQVEDFYVKHRFEHGEHGFDAEWHRWAAGWLVFVGSAVISLNILMIIFRVLYLKSILKYYFVLYALIICVMFLYTALSPHIQSSRPQKLMNNVVLSALFALSLFVGGIVSAIFASDNGNLWLDLCSDYNIRERELDFCNDLQRLASTESATAALSFLSTIVFIVLILLMIYSGIAKAREENQLNGYSPLLQVAESHQQPTSVSPHPEAHPEANVTQSVEPSAPSPLQPLANMSDHVIPSAPLYPVANVSSYSSPSSPLCPPINIQPYGSTAPPPYESVVAMSQHVPSGGPLNDYSKTGTA